jgi:hypothetical protein
MSALTQVPTSVEARPKLSADARKIREEIKERIQSAFAHLQEAERLCGRLNCPSEVWDEVIVAKYAAQTAGFLATECDD